MDDLFKQRLSSPEESRLEEHAAAQQQSQRSPHDIRTKFGLSTVLAVVLLTACDNVEVAGSRTGVFDDDSSGADFLNRACINSNTDIAICPATDMAKIAKGARIAYEHADYDWSNGPLKLYAARNETIAFQLVMHQKTDSIVSNVNLKFGPATATNTARSADFVQSAFNTFYHPIDNADYSWGPPTPVLPWPGEYPDALIPTEQNCATNNFPSNIALTAPASKNTNQSIWIDTYIPKQSSPGTYEQIMELSIDGEVVELPVEVTVYDAVLPDKPTINAIGELYRTYSLEGVGFDMSSPEWQNMSQCYQKLAHQHRMVFIERIPDLLTDAELEDYADTIEPALTGELFDAASGYIGPGANTPVAIWKTPWPQTIDAASLEALSNTEVNRYSGLASTWNDLTTRRGWPELDYFAYVFDEVDGPGNTGNANETRSSYIERVHGQMADVQSAIDDGANDIAIDLIWTSHSNPASWAGQPGQDLTGTIRLWAPNAGAADTDFLQQRIAEGEKAWFYHHGHPALGAHSINASGIEMRTWGVIGARYNFQGQFMWAVNLGSNDFPFRDPQYRPDETRAGNGVLVYPGNQLDRIGYEKSPGPIPSMRLKSWRRGLQDAELYYLATQTQPSAADALIKQQVPTALTDGDGDASWSSESGDWIDFHKALLELASDR